MNPLDQNIDHLPTNPGVYLFKDRKGTVLYVGKAGNIRHRVASYFKKLSEKDVKTSALLGKVADIDTIVTSTEKEALILEDNLVKEHHPRYNVKLRDDKRYPCLKLSMEEDFPTLRIVRRIQKDSSIYFGPYPSAASLKETLRLIRRLFPIRTCLNTKFSSRLRPCINYEMNRCLGPCCGKIDPVQYREILGQVRMFLEGKNRDLVGRLRRKMEEESERLCFEGAASLRDQIEHIEHVIEKQKMVSSDFIDQDVVGFYRRGDSIVIHPLFVRGGKLLGGRSFILSPTELPDEEVLSSFLHQYYREGKFIPERVLIPKAIPDRAFVERWLTEQKGKKVQLRVPVKGEKKDLLNLACENAQQVFLAKADLEIHEEKLFEGLKEKLHLTRVPRRIEAFDISNLQGGDAVGSMVCFQDGKPAKEGYRHFKIKTIQGADDYGMMYEVLFRRYSKVDQDHLLPDLILVDGGRGQLNVAQGVLKELGIEGVDLLSLAKERKDGRSRSEGTAKTEEKIFHPDLQGSLVLPKHSSLLLFLDRIRDEAHRFAIAYHKKIRSRQAIRSVLEGIPGIGKVRRKALFQYFGSIEKIKEAHLETLAKVPTMNLRTAQNVYSFFHEGEK